VVTYNLPSLGSGCVSRRTSSRACSSAISPSGTTRRSRRFNPGKQLPDLSIIVGTPVRWKRHYGDLHRLLTKVSKTWSEKVGKGPSVNWPVGLGGKGSEGVAGLREAV